MVNVFHSCASVALPAESYPENSLTERIEASINESLPVLAKLDAALTAHERSMVFDEAIAASFIAFTLKYGDPFGCRVVTQCGCPLLPSFNAGQSVSFDSQHNIF